MGTLDFLDYVLKKPAKEILDDTSEFYFDKDADTLGKDIKSGINTAVDVFKYAHEKPAKQKLDEAIDYWVADSDDTGKPYDGETAPVELGPFHAESISTAGESGLLEAADEAADQFKIPRTLYRNLIQRESSFDPHVADSVKGAKGIAQFLPETFYGKFKKNKNGKKVWHPGVMEHGDIYNPAHGLYAGAKYLRQMHDYWTGHGYKGSEAWKFALASYNGGMGNWKQAHTDAVSVTGKSNPTFKEVGEHRTNKDSIGYANEVLNLQPSKGAMVDTEGFKTKMDPRVFKLTLQRGIEQLKDGAAFLARKGLDIDTSEMSLQAQRRIQQINEELGPDVLKEQQIRATVDAGRDEFNFKLNPEYFKKGVFLHDAAGSVPSTGVGMVTGATLTQAMIKGLTVAGIKLGPKLAGLIGATFYGGAEGVIQGTFTAMDVGRTIRGMDYIALEGTPAYDAFIAQGDSPEVAKNRVASVFENEAGTNAALLTTMLGGPMGAKFTNWMNFAKRTKPGSVAVATVQEMGEEVLQEGGVSVATNLKMNKTKRHEDQKDARQIWNEGFEDGARGGFGVIPLAASGGLAAKTYGGIGEGNIEIDNDVYMRFEKPKVDPSISPTDPVYSELKQRKPSEYGNVKKVKDGWEVIEKHPVGGDIPLVFKSKSKAKKLAEEIKKAIKEEQKPSEDPTDINQPVGYRKRIGKKFTDALNPISNVPDNEIYQQMRYKTLGNMGGAASLSNLIYKGINEGNKKDKQAAYEYLTSDITSVKIKNEVVRHSSERAKKILIALGEQAVKDGVLSQETMEANRGMYLPRLYLIHILAGKTGITGGAAVSPQGYLKQRLSDEDFPEDIRGIAYGEIKDPAYLAAHSIGVIGRDQALINLLREVSKNPKWLLQDTMVEWQGEPVSAVWLAQQADRMTNFAPHQESEEAQLKTLAQAKEMNDLAAPALKFRDVKGYERVPETNKYGKLAGALVHKEIFNDILVQQHRNPHASKFEQWVGVGGRIERLNQFWKTMKVAANPGSQVRNFVSNGSLMHLSGVAMPMVPVRLVQSAYSMATNGTAWKEAKARGVKETTFSNQEMWRINRKFADLQRKEGKGFGVLKSMGVWFVERVGDIYGGTEALFKTAKMIDVRAKGGSWDRGAIDAHEAMFDYSLVLPSVRAARTHALGAPFLTFTTKVIPFVIKTAIANPSRSIPYLVMGVGMAAVFKERYDIDEEDLEALKQTLASWIRDKGTVYFMWDKDEHGRWQAIDLSYFLPWGIFHEIAHSLKDGNLGSFIKTLGLLGGPIPDIAAAVLTGIDPFTGRPIWDEADPAQDQWYDIMKWTWSLGAPSWLGDRGAMEKLYDYLTGEVNVRSGEPILTKEQMQGRFFGVNIQPLDPVQSRADNLRFMKYDMDKTKRRMKKMLRNKNLNNEEKQKIRAKFKEKIQEMAQQRREYAKKTRIHPNLR